MADDRFIAIDWGTTNRRTFVIEGGTVVSTERDGAGILSFAPDDFPNEIVRLSGLYRGAPLLLAGMIGSNRGWQDAGYVAAPASVQHLADALLVPEPDRFPDMRIVPGVRSAVGGRADIMRGEEVQLLGAVATGAAPPDALLCQPGTHCKWAQMRDGLLAAFTTAMTGELFALLRDHSLVGPELAGSAELGETFAEGVRRSAEQDLLAALFGVRASSVLGERVPGTAASYVSGLLIGSDCRSQLPQPGTMVYVLADGYLADAYAAAIRLLGCEAKVIDSHAAFVAGITRIWESAR